MKGFLERLCYRLCVLFLFVSLLSVYFGAESGRKVELYDDAAGHTFREVTPTGNPWSPWLFWGGLVGMFASGATGYWLGERAKYGG